MISQDTKLCITMFLVMFTSFMLTVWSAFLFGYFIVVILKPLSVEHILAVFGYSIFSGLFADFCFKKLEPGFNTDINPYADCDFVVDSAGEYHPVRKK